jgi:hypothetical protein
MARTTLNIDDMVMRDLKRIQRKERRPLGQLVSELLVLGIEQHERPGRVAETPPFTWISKPMGPMLVDIEDREALQEMFDREDFPELFK